MRLIDVRIKEKIPKLGVHELSTSLDIFFLFFASSLHGMPTGQAVSRFGSGIFFFYISSS